MGTKREDRLLEYQIKQRGLSMSVEEFKQGVYAEYGLNPMDEYAVHNLVQKELMAKRDEGAFPEEEQDAWDAIIHQMADDNKKKGKMLFMDPNIRPAVWDNMFRRLGYDEANKEKAADLFVMLLYEEGRQVWNRRKKKLLTYAAFAIAVIVALVIYF